MVFVLHKHNDEFQMLTDDVKIHIFRGLISALYRKITWNSAIC